MFFHSFLGDKWADSDDDSNTIDINSSHNSRRRINEQPVRDNAGHNPNRYDFISKGKERNFRRL